MNEGFNSRLYANRELGRSEGYNPEFPVLQCLCLDIFPELLPHVVKALPCYGHPCCWELLLACTAEEDMLSQQSSALIHSAAHIPGKVSNCSGL